MNFRIKKVVSFILATMMISNLAFAGESSAPSNSAKIAKAFNSFRYAVTVQWDQKDQAVYNKAVDTFRAQIAALQAEGVSATEIAQYMRESFLDESMKADFDRLMNAIDASKVSGEEAGEIAMNYLNGRYQEGASYSGGAPVLPWIIVIVGVVVITTVVVIIVKWKKHDKEPCPEPTPLPTPTEPCDTPIIVR